MNLVDRLNKYGIYSEAFERYKQEGNVGQTRTDIIYKYAEEITSRLWCITRDELVELAGDSWTTKELNPEEKALFDKMEELKDLGKLCIKKSIDDYNNM